MIPMTSFCANLRCGSVRVGIAAVGAFPPNRNLGRRCSGCRECAGRARYSRRECAGWPGPYRSTAPTSSLTNNTFSQVFPPSLERKTPRSGDDLNKSPNTAAYTMSGLSGRMRMRGIWRLSFNPACFQVLPASSLFPGRNRRSRCRARSLRRRRRRSRWDEGATSTALTEPPKSVGDVFQNTSAVSGAPRRRRSTRNRTGWAFPRRRSRRPNGRRGRGRHSAIQGRCKAIR